MAHNDRINYLMKKVDDLEDVLDFAYQKELLYRLRQALITCVYNHDLDKRIWRDADRFKRSSRK
jgi:hypothetical protein